ncbi:MAG: DinB family protein [Alloacidobacterium sp.]
MKKILTQYGVFALAIALMVPLAQVQVQAQAAGMQAAWGKDAGTLSDKFAGLARVMSGKYDWKPGQGVRSVGDVFNLIVKENGMLAGVLSGTPNTGAQPAPITDPEKLQEALKASYVNLQKAITGLSDNDLQAPVKLFGRDMTKQGALMLILEDQHEHLGQSIAYARSNGVVPPWSKEESRARSGPVLIGGTG